MKKINIAILGFGGIAKTHAMGIYSANLLFDLPFELTLSHIISSRAGDIKMRGVIVEDTMEKAFKDIKPDIIDICSINQMHFDAIKEIAEKGYSTDIYCEKPIADNINDSKAAVDIVKENNIINGVALVLRFLPCLNMLKEKVASKELGNIIEFKAKFYHKSYLSEKTVMENKRFFRRRSYFRFRNSYGRCNKICFWRSS